MKTKWLVMLCLGGLLAGIAQAAGTGGTQERDRTRDRKRDGSCQVTADQSRSNDQDRDRARKRDGSCRWDADRDRDQDRDRNRDGSCKAF